MASSRDDDQQRTSQRLIEQELAEGVIRAQKTINRYTNMRKETAMQNQNPDVNPELLKALKDVDVATLNAFDAMRHYIKEDTDGIWNQTVVGHDHDDTPVVLGSKPLPEVQEGDVRRPEDVPEGVAFLDDYQGAIERETRERHVEFKGRKIETRYRPKLLPIECYKNTVAVLQRVLKQTEFAPQTPTPEVHSDPLL